MKTRHRTTIGTIAIAALVASCSGGTDGATEPGTDDTESIGAQRSDLPDDLAIDPGTEATAAALPPGADPLWSVELDSIPQLAEDRLVGLLYPGGTESELSIIGFDDGGTPQWRVTTNPSCAGYGVTRHADRDLVIILDSDADIDSGGVATRTTATAFDANDGSTVWGPVDVPGPLRGPGLIFGETPGSIVSDESGPRVMLAASDGSVVADETAGDVIHYEHHGIGVFERDGLLQAHDTDTEERLWSGADLNPPPEAQPEAQPTTVTGTSASIGDSLTLAWPGTSGNNVYATYDLRTGALEAQLPGEPDGAPVSDSSTDTTLFTTSTPEGRQLVATGPDGIRWSQQFPDDASVDAISGDTVYGRQGSNGLALDLADGVTRAEGAWSPPASVMGSGVGIFQAHTDDSSRYVAASIPDS